MVQTVQEIRYAFERDMVRKRGYKAFSNAGIIVLCVECEQDFDAKVSNQVVCNNCRPERVRKQTRERVRRHRERVPYQSVAADRDMATFNDLTGADKHNLVTALIRACVREMLYTYATVHRPLYRIGTELWLTEFAEPFMAACGEHIDIDTILEKIDDQS